MKSDSAPASPDLDRQMAADTAQHRDLVGGMWGEIGKLQFDFIVNSGLRPEHSLLDIGCGSFRGGVHFARYLSSGNYFGFDINPSLVDAGYEKELTPLGLDKKVPRRNIVIDGGFDFSQFARKFDFALAQSVFTHLPLNSIRTCLERLKPHIQPSGLFFATIFEAPLNHPLYQPSHHSVGGIVTCADRDPYHYRIDDIDYIAQSVGWTIRWIGDFDHPRDQKMIEFSPKAD